MTLLSSEAMSVALILCILPTAVFSAERVRRQEKGIKGDQGIKGEPGPPGLPGPPGAVGPRGQRGDDGSKGDMGLPGARGVQGPAGDPGPPGLPGEPGLPGPPGRDGAPGVKGDKGSRAEKGDIGDIGPVGPKGDMGDRGERGDFGQRGLPGMKGERGRQGVSGERGLQGDKGDRGPPGLGGNFSSSGAGVLYTRWGRRVCGGPLGDPAPGTELVYSGIAGSSDVGTNFMCMPDNPDSSSNSSRGLKDLRGAKYFNHPSGRDGLYVPCAVCYVTTRSSVMMIPAKSSCPPNWTMEYGGYLMGNAVSMSQHECVDQDPEVASDDKGGRRGRHDFFSIKVDCDNGLTCPPYNDNALSCVICTR